MGGRRGGGVGGVQGGRGERGEERERGGRGRGGRGLKYKGYNRVTRQDSTAHMYTLYHAMCLLYYHIIS